MEGAAGSRTSSGEAPEAALHGGVAQSSQPGAKQSWAPGAAVVGRQVRGLRGLSTMLGRAQRRSAAGRVAAVCSLHVPGGLHLHGMEGCKGPARAPPLPRQKSLAAPQSWVGPGPHLWGWKCQPWGYGGPGQSLQLLPPQWAGVSWLGLHLQAAGRGGHLSPWEVRDSWVLEPMRSEVHPSVERRKL